MNERFSLRNLLRCSARFVGAWWVLGMTLNVEALEPFRVQVVDRENGWPVPLVELRTNHAVRFMSDNAGVIAVDAPEMMGVDTWFEIAGHGYSVPADGFGFRGVRLTPTPGGRHIVQVDRQYPAKRLGRLTGGGLFSESQKLNEHVDWREQGVWGCDSVQTAIYGDKQFWAWGDTVVPSYPLGVFDTLGATTPLQPLSRWKPPIQLRYDYFRDSAEKPIGVAKMPGDGPTWITGLATVSDKEQRPRLVATYMKVKPPLTIYEKGLCVWSDEANRFERQQVVWQRSDEREQGDEREQAPRMPEGHAVVWKDSKGVEWLLFCDPFPQLQCLNTFEAWGDPQTWQRPQAQSRVPVASIDRKRTGDNPKDSAPESVEPHRGSMAWNDFMKQWIAVWTRLNGRSHLGEIWYAESDSPFGPWKNAVQVASHDNYSFYNPCLHPEWTGQSASEVVFEGTFTQMFADRPPHAPRHEYNQVLYLIDLKDIRSKLEKPK